MTLIFCISFTIISTDEVASKNIGYIVITFIVTMVGANLIIISFTSSTAAFKSVKRICLKRKQVKKTIKLVEIKKEKQKLKAIMQAEKLKL